MAFRAARVECAALFVGAFFPTFDVLYSSIVLYSEYDIMIGYVYQTGIQAKPAATKLKTCTRPPLCCCGKRAVGAEEPCLCDPRLYTVVYSTRGG